MAAGSTKHVLLLCSIVVLISCRFGHAPAQCRCDWCRVRPVGWYHVGSDTLTLSAWCSGAYGSKEPRQAPAPAQWSLRHDISALTLKARWRLAGRCQAGRCQAEANRWSESDILVIMCVIKLSCYLRKHRMIFNTCITNHYSKKSLKTPVLIMDFRDYDHIVK